MDKKAKIYVAGHQGMVGSAIVRCLEEQGYSNLVLKTHSELDLTNQDNVNKFFENERPEYVFLTAAKVGGIKANADLIADFLMVNLQIQNNVLSATHKYKVKKLLFTASACIYPKNCEQPIKEEALLTGKLEPTNEGYALAKIAGLKACYYYNKQYGTNFITAMPANAYGINDHFDTENAHVIPSLIKRFHQAKINQVPEVEMWGTGKPLREFLYVDDLADACVFLMKYYDKDDFINIGTGEEVSMHELALLIKKVIGYNGDIVFDTSKPDGMMRRIVDSSKIKALGWKRKTDLQTGIQSVYDWYLKNE
ncbi:NAD-dependent epimerase/dehydratase family protein [Eubacterium callanderi]|uniref:GDP-L-fucose synthase n=1 Tax=Eubacterium callanderi TaxID=53442 RepID=A0A853JWB4_9FIRM|nr:GDP-L-fucose synthase [Eubacterium callanderi]